MNMSGYGKNAAIIAEYNPFHNGHQFHIARTRELTGAETITVIMSGNFVQRGECAICDKYSRTRMALNGGADLVLELPLPFACAGAENFARGGVEIAEALGCVDYLSFGTEFGSVEELSRAADAVSDEAVKPELDSLLSLGTSFASARTEAVRRIYGDSVAELICMPNNTLAVEYIRALKRAGSAIEPVGITREGAAHDSRALSGETASATAIRSMISEGKLDEAGRYIPGYTLRELEKLVEEERAPAEIIRCERAILSRLRSLTKDQLSRLPDISEGLENRIFESARSACSLEELYDSVKSKRYSHARIRRIILSAFLGIRREHSEKPRYIRILGMNGRGRQILSRARPSLPLISSFHQANALPTQARNQYLLECHAGDMWGLMTPAVQPCGQDMTSKMIVME
jgi:Predicted nucleotidyltransferase